MRMKKEEVEKKIGEGEREIEAKEKELADLTREVKLLEEEMILDVVRMESEKLSKEEMMGAFSKQKEDEVRELDLETVIDEKKEGIRKLKKMKEDHEEERRLED